MNKILIKDLLNSSDSFEFKREVKNINSKLLKLCSQLPESNIVNNKDIYFELQNIITSLKMIMKKRNINSEEKTLVTITFQLASTITSLIQSVSSIKRKVKPELTANTKPFSIVTQNMMNNNRHSSASYTGHRFSKTNVEILELWFKEHQDRPYLDKRSTASLEKQTLLSKVQIKNWVSNRRRKQKTRKVSNEILDLVNNE